MNFEKRWMVSIIVDSIIIFLSVTGAYLLLNLSNVMVAIVVFSLFWLVIIGGFSYTGLYQRFWRYASIGEISLLAKTSLVAIAFVYIISLFFNWIELMQIPVLMVLIAGAGIIAGIFTTKLLLRIVKEDSGELSKRGKRTLIVGAGSAGVLVLKELRKSSDQPLSPAVFIDDDSNKVNLHVLGIPVVGRLEDFDWVIRKYKIEVVIIAIPSAPKEVITQIVSSSKEQQVEIKILPLIRDIIDGKITIQRIRDVKVEDLLGRPPIQLDLKGIAEYVSGKVVLISGAGGSIGSEICRQVSQFKPKLLLLLGHGENSIYAIENELKKSCPDLACHALVADVQDKQRLQNLYAYFRPDVVFHAAAHKHVPLMESNPTEAIKNNVFGTKNSAECADEFGVERFVMISTDKAVNPTSVMGVTKRMAEMVVQSIHKKSETSFVTVRFGNVLGSRGSVIPLFKKQILEGGPVTVTHPDMTRYFMTIPEAVQLVLQSGSLASGGEIFILDMGEPVKISDLAKDLITLSGLVPGKDIEITYTGMRPGEKLYEELFTSEEESTSSKHELIYQAKSVEISEQDLYQTLDLLRDKVYETESEQKLEEIRSILKNIVPTYKG